ncbi:hypothetical protein [Pelagovum pacificum]|uniref:hypothetical protein n=1 Tax=Pelagovum pacificum TaxID=2588711 RepID=UPI0018CC932C|nr:hypothetical protein [Pelagovum pacificum]QQA42752.1 hypothetical protein I8N54_18585 [Pelagovum pacificum]
MLTILADALMNATRTRHGKDIPGQRDDWSDRFVPESRRGNRGHRFNAFRDLW